MTNHKHFTNREIASLDDAGVAELCRVLKNRSMAANREAASLNSSYARANRENKRRISAKKHLCIVDIDIDSCDLQSTKAEGV